MVYYYFIRDENKVSHKKLQTSTKTKNQMLGPVKYFNCVNL
jgi:hypothetical protein